MNKDARGAQSVRRRVRAYRRRRQGVRQSRVRRARPHRHPARGPLYPENWFPFSTAQTTDPFSGKTGALLRGDGSDPLLIETNTSTEYWQKGASLLTIDPLGKRDLALPANSRVYLIAGTQHGGRAGLKPTRGVCANPSNPHSPAPALRALVVALEEWVTKGIAPPASRVPTMAAGNRGRVCRRRSCRR